MLSPLLRDMGLRTGKAHGFREPLKHSARPRIPETPECKCISNM